MQTITDYRTYYNKIVTENELIKTQIKSKQVKIKISKLLYEKLIKARFVLSEVLNITQMNFKTVVEELGTLFLRSIYIDNDFALRLKFEVKRNKSECEIVVEENGEEFKPKDEMGGGVLDTISTALRIIMWSLSRPRTRNVLILDEPGKFLGILQKQFAEILKEISKKMNLQIIMITHDSNLLEIADKAFIVEKEKDFSIVRQVGEQNETQKIIKIKRRNS